MDLSYCQLLRFHTVSTYPRFADASVSSAIAIRTGDRERLSLSIVKHKVKQAGMYHNAMVSRS